MTGWGRLGTSLMTSRRLGLFLCLVGFVWGLTLMNMTLIGYNSEPDSEHLKGEILQLSEKYVKTLAKETENTIDGPYSGRLTGYDLKKTMAVLLQNIMERLTKLEQRVDQALLNNSLSPNLRKELEAVRSEVKELPALAGPVPNNPDHPMFPVLPDKEDQKADKTGAGASVTRLKMDGPVDAKGLIMGEQEKCELEEDEAKKFQHCKGKINWMKAHWKSDPCYREYGVDGTDCSFRMYLSEVENWCPHIPGRASNKTLPNQNIRTANLNLGLDNLLAKLQDPGQRKNYMWIRMRISRMWSRWVAAAKNLNRKEDLSERKQKKVLVHLGLLTKQSGFKIAEGSFKGGPLGELVQWSDIIAALYILGHDLTITSEVEHLQGNILKKQGKYYRASCPSKSKSQVDLLYTDIVGLRQLKRLLKSNLAQYRMLARFPSAESQCQSREKLPLHMIFTDIVGLTQFKRKVKNGYGKFSCLLRIIDSFGTEPAFNNEAYAKTHHMKTQWGMQNLNPEQFFTMFPHSPDNSFMGFVVENHINETNAQEVPRRNKAVVYGKAQYMWQGKESYLNIIREFADIHGTVFIDVKKEKSTIPSYVTNHGILKGPDLHRLLRESKLFIGLGFPYEGPAPLEAIAQGCVFINPKFSPPHSSINTQFFKGKPTRRKVTSQHPYAEEFIGEPHVYTVDISNPDSVRQALRSAMKDHNDSKIEPYLPYEYTEEGMLQRLNVYLEHQDYCNPFPTDWPPPQAVSIMPAPPGRSCKDVCMSKRRICEPAYFKQINNQETLEKFFGPCETVVKVDDIYFPAYNSVKKQCLLQNQALLFSCVGEHSEVARLCPCRDFMRGQTALCQDCIKTLPPHQS